MSGMNHRNEFTPEHIAQLLKNIGEQRKLHGHLLPSEPSAQDLNAFLRILQAKRESSRHTNLFILVIDKLFQPFRRRPAYSLAFISATIIIIIIPLLWYFTRPDRSYNLALLSNQEAQFKPTNQQLIIQHPLSLTSSIEQAQHEPQPEPSPQLFAARSRSQPLATPEGKLALSGKMAPPSPPFKEQDAVPLEYTVQITDIRTFSSLSNEKGRGLDKQKLLFSPSQTLVIKINETSIILSTASGLHIPVQFWPKDHQVPLAQQKQGLSNQTILGQPPIPMPSSIPIAIIQDIHSKADLIEALQAQKPIKVHLLTDAVDQELVLTPILSH